MSETTIIKGRNQRTAKLLLAAAAQLEQDTRVVKTTMGGYRVPNDVAERYAELDAELTKAEGKPEQKEPVLPAAAATAAVDAQAAQDSGETEKKTPARKTAAKKTTPRKSAVKKES